MLNRNILELLAKKGFKYLGCNQPDIGIFFKPQNDGVLDVCILSDHTGGYFYSPSHLLSIFNEIERKFIFNGFREFNCHYIIFTDNLSREHDFAATGLSFWLVDNSTKRLIIYENQPDDFNSLKKELENIITALPEKKLKTSSFPFATAAIIAINVTVFILMEFFGSTIDTSFMAKHGAMSWQFLFENQEYFRLISSMFMHFGIEHIINNMITLAVIGNEVERILGHFRFIIIYFLSGIGAGFVSALYNMNVNHDTFIISAGASGAIFGIIGALLVISLLYKNVRRNIQPANITIIILLSIFNGFMNFEIDSMAHIGGLMFGIIITFICCVCSKIVIK